MPYDTTSLGAGISQALESYAKQQEEIKNRAREFKALQEYADAAGYADKNTTITWDRDRLKGFVRGKEAQVVQQERQEAAAREERRVRIAEQAAEQDAAAAPFRLAYLNEQTAALKAAQAAREVEQRRLEQERGRVEAFNQDVSGQTAGPGMRALAGYANAGPLSGPRPELSGLAGMAGQGFQEQSLNLQGLMAAQARHGLLKPEQVDNLGAILAREPAARGGGLPRDFMPQPFEVGGFTGIVSPLTGETRIKPVPGQGEKPPAATITITEKDKAGNTITRKLTEAQYQAELAAKAARPAIPAAVQQEADRLRRDIMEDEAQRAVNDERRWYGAKRADKIKENQSRLAALERQYPGLVQPARRLIYKMDANGNLTPQ